MKKQFIETGKIVGTHGIGGEMRVQPWADSPKALCRLKRLFIDEQGSEIKIKSSRVHGNVVLIKAEGVDSIEAAEKMRNKVIYAAREDVVPSDGHLIADIIGCKVYDADTDALYGEISAVSQTGANDVWHISKDGREYLMPAIDEIIESVDIENDIVKIHPMKGLFDDED